MSDEREPQNLGQSWWEDRVRGAAIASCIDHYEREHVNTVPPCAGARREAEWWAVAFGIARLTPVKEGSS